MGGRHGWSHTGSSHTQNLPIANQNYPGVAGHVNAAYTNTLSGNEMPFDGFNAASFHGGSPEARSPSSPPFPTFPSDQFAHSRRPSVRPSSTAVYGSGVTSALDSDINNLRQTRQTLEYECHTLKLEVAKLQSQRSQLRRGSPSSSNSQNSTPPQSANFQSSWNTRTDARIRYLCSLNRAGNALCAWHDSRRERRAFPPRNAPPGYLNCGCTYDEALFEESLSRHQVGSYLPGETVRMDPALRNPLLKLLQRRYGYQDGDFERDHRTGEWFDGEGPAKWEQLAQTGPSISRRRVDHDRH